MLHDEFGTSRTARNFKLLVIAGCLGTLVFLGLEAFQEHAGGDWRRWQGLYASKLAPEFRGSFEFGIKQVFLPALERVDRCQTCHAGIDDPTMAAAAQPLRTHPGDTLRIHAIERFGCTICHQGHGRATTLDAHGYAPNWDQPMLRDGMIYTSCALCHAENGLFGDDVEHYGGRVADAEIYEGDLARSLPGADLLHRGKQLVAKSGCLGCHAYRGRGGALGPDLTRVGSKTAHEYDYSHVPEGIERTALGWLQAHFLDPGAVSPGTVMPNAGVTQEDAQALTAYMLSLRTSSVPAEYRPVPASGRGNPLGGRGLYELFCVACHGKSLDSGGVPAIVTPSLSNEDFLTVATEEYLASMIRHGRSGTMMIPWDGSGGNLTSEQVDRIVEYVLSHEPKKADLDTVVGLEGDPESGAELYEENCAPCHGKDGEGRLGATLNSQDLLSILSDETIARTIIDGRRGAGMPSGAGLSDQEVADLVRFIRGFQDAGSDVDSVVGLLARGSGDAQAGKLAYEQRCAYCHAPDGQGAIGPSLNTSFFLSIASDEFLARSIRDGRAGTSMPAHRDLSAEDLGNLIRHIRSFGQGGRVELRPVAAAGDPDYGALLYERTCTACHGVGGTGGTGPGVGNPAFLSQASDAFLREASGFDRHAHVPGSHSLASLADPQIVDIVAYLRHLEDVPPTQAPRRPVYGDPERGRLTYEGRAGCARCHGSPGEGRQGQALGSRAYFEQTTQGFVVAAMVRGIQGTTMPSFSSQGPVPLSPEELLDVAAYMRTLPERPPAGRTERRVYERTEEQVAMGRDLYQRACSTCHSPTDQGKKAPLLKNREFLAAASDGFLMASIARGRRGTTMLPFGLHPDAAIVLGPDDILNLIGFLRSLEEPDRPVEGAAVR